MEIVIAPVADANKLVIRKKSPTSAPYIIYDDVYVASFFDEFFENGDLYSYIVYHDSEVLKSVPLFSPTISQSLTFNPQDLFHPEEWKTFAPAASCNPLLTIVHQNTLANDWWKTTRSWLTRFNSDLTTVTVNDSLFYPKSQETVNYNEILTGDMYFMSAQAFEFVLYLSQQIEKSDFAYPETLPKKFSMTELLTSLDVGLRRFNSFPPYTYFNFHFAQKLDLRSVPDEMKSIIVRYAVIELLQSLVIYWIDNSFSYSSGVDIEAQKDYSARLSELLTDTNEECRRVKWRFKTGGFFVGTTKGFGYRSGAGFSGNGGSQASNSTTYLSAISGYPGVLYNLLARTT